MLVGRTSRGLRSSLLQDRCQQKTRLATALSSHGVTTSKGGDSPALGPAFPVQLPSRESWECKCPCSAGHVPQRNPGCGLLCLSCERLGPVQLAAATSRAPPQWGPCSSFSSQPGLMQGLSSAAALVFLWKWLEPLVAW